MISLYFYFSIKKTTQIYCDAVRMTLDMLCVNCVAIGQNLMKQTLLGVMVSFSCTCTVVKKELLYPLPTAPKPNPATDWVSQIQSIDL